jgi:hypothetical protein
MQSARQLAEAAVVAYRSADMALHSAAASLQLSRLAPGRKGDELRRSAMAWMHQRSVRNPARIAALIVPLGGETELVENLRPPP